MKFQYKCPEVKAWFTTSSSGNVQLWFYKSSITKRHRDKYFKENLFQVMEPIDLPSELAQSLGLSEERKVILPGIYNVKILSDTLVVEFHHERPYPACHQICQIAASF
jgi:hypothetical protein